MTLTIFWIVLTIILIAIDILTSTFLFCFIAIGTFIAMIANLIGASFIVQVIIAGIVSVIAIAVGVPFARKKFKTDIKSKPLMEETYIGRVFNCEENIKEEGRLKVSGIYWAVVNEGEEILKGDKLIITGIVGSKLKIKKYKGEK